MNLDSPIAVVPFGELKGLLTDIGIEENYCAFQI